MAGRPATVKIENLTNYDGRTVRKIVTRVANGVEVDPSLVVVNYVLEYPPELWGGLPRYVTENAAFCGYAQQFSRSVGFFLNYPDYYPAAWSFDGRLKLPDLHLQDWQEALVCVAAHEFTHIRQFDQGDELTEREPSYAEIRYLEDWRQGKL